MFIFFLDTIILGIGLLVASLISVSAVVSINKSTSTTDSTTGTGTAGTTGTGAGAGTGAGTDTDTTDLTKNDAVTIGMISGIVSLFTAVFSSIVAIIFIASAKSFTSFIGTAIRLFNGKTLDAFLLFFISPSSFFFVASAVMFVLSFILNRISGFNKLVGYISAFILSIAATFGVYWVNNLAYENLKNQSSLKSFVNALPLVNVTTKDGIVEDVSSEGSFSKK